MKLIIDIPDEIYEFIKDRGHLPYAVSLANAIEDGEILPNNHGDLIDRDIAYAEFDKEGCSYEGQLLKYIPTVIKSNKR